MNAPPFQHTIPTRHQSDRSMIPFNMWLHNKLLKIEHKRMLFYPPSCSMWWLVQCASMSQSSSLFIHFGRRETLMYGHAWTFIDKHWNIITVTLTMVYNMFCWTASSRQKYLTSGYYIKFWHLPDVTIINNKYSTGGCCSIRHHVACDDQYNVHQWVNPVVCSYTLVGGRLWCMDTPGHSLVSIGTSSLSLT